MVDHIGGCCVHNVDFPMHIPENTQGILDSKLYKPVYNDNGFVNGQYLMLGKGSKGSASVNGHRPRTALETVLGARFNEGRWFACIHAHLILEHQGLDGGALWAGMTTLHGKWYAGTNKARQMGYANLVDWQDGLSLSATGKRMPHLFRASIDPEKAMPSKHWAGWRTIWRKMVGDYVSV